MMSFTIRFVLPLLVLAAIFPTLEGTQYERYCPFSLRTKTRGVCGRSLTNMISIICRGRFFSGKKRSGAEPGAPLLPPIVEEMGELPEAEDVADFMSKRNALSVFRTGQGKRGPMTRGIICECCINRCTIREMQSYCQ